MLKCETNTPGMERFSRKCKFGYEGCYEKHGTAPKITGFKRLSDEEAGAVVIPNIPKWTDSCATKGPRGQGHASWGDGKMHVSAEELAIQKERGLGMATQEEVIARYFKAIGVPLEHQETCTQSKPCDKHRGALRGRDWKTGEYL